jgi:RNA-directed DNA polymerase
MEINTALYLTHSEILHRAINLNNEAFYKHRTQNKMKFGKPKLDKNGNELMRNILSPVYHLKLKQRAINIPLRSIELPSSMYGGVTKRNNIQNAQMHVDSKFFLTIDLKNYFSNISNDRIYQTLISYGFNQRNARLITRLSTINNSLPQGAPTSTVIANLVFAATALELEKLCEKKKIIFTNFVDDLTFSSKRNFKSMVPQILELLKRNGFIVNQSKIHYKRGSCEITGLFIKNRKMYPEKNMLQNLHNPGIRAYVKLVESYNAMRAA